MSMCTYTVTFSGKCSSTCDFLFFFLGTEPDGLLRTNYTSVLTNVGAALRGFHDVMKGEL